VDAVRRTIVVRHGKGDKDRVVPIGKRALGWLLKYAHEVRAELLALKPNERLGPIVVTLDDQERTSRRAFVITERDFFGAVATVA
jgi:integrase/recombinase XerD